MDEKSRIIRSKESQEEEKRYLEILNKHFDNAVTCEKHPNAMLNIIFRDSYEKVLGHNFSKQRISKRKEKKLKDTILSELRRKYGRWINLTNFKAKTPGNIFFKTNFNRVYKVNGQPLYGSPLQHISEGIFYTAHSLERFEERADSRLYAPVIESLEEIFKTKPTSADIIMGLIMCSNFEHGKWKEFLYLNIGVGALVLEDLDDIFIAKTFLSIDMINRDMAWYEPLLEPGFEPTSFKELMDRESIKIHEATFIVDKLANALSELFLEEE